MTLTDKPLTSLEGYYCLSTSHGAGPSIGGSSLPSSQPLKRGCRFSMNAARLRGRREDGQ